jgi:hypothetical protein
VFRLGKRKSGDNCCAENLLENVELGDEEGKIFEVLRTMNILVVVSNGLTGSYRFSKERLVHNPEEGCDTFLRNFGNHLQVHMSLQSRDHDREGNRMNPIRMHIRERGCED